MQLGVRIPDSNEIDDVDFCQRAEDEWGYESVWAGELWGTDIFVRLTTIASQTSSIGLGVGIANVFSRSPATLAMAGASLQDDSSGRVKFGVGPGSRKTIEDLHGLTFERPIRRIHESVELIQRFTRGNDETVSYDGKVFTVDEIPSLGTGFPIYNAALGPANRRVTGRLCDGWLPHNAPLSNLENLFEEIRSAAESAGRNPDSIEVRPFVPVAVDPDPEVAYATLRKHIAYYAGSSSGYRNALAAEFSGDVSEIAATWNDGEHDEAAELVPDSMVDGIGIAGDPEDARETLRSLYDRDIVDALVLVVPLQADREITMQTFDAVSPRNLAAGENV